MDLLLSSALHWSELPCGVLTPPAPAVHYQGPPAAPGEVAEACPWNPQEVGGSRGLGPDSLLHWV